jgi:predicted DNA-binding transcriptional regulator YafY
MSILKYLDRIKQMDELIRRKATGSPDEFAEKVGLSRSALMKYIKLLKELNAPLEYDHNRQSYYYLFFMQIENRI